MSGSDWRNLVLIVAAWLLIAAGLTLIRWPLVLMWLGVGLAVFVDWE